MGDKGEMGDKGDIGNMGVIVDEIYFLFNCPTIVTSDPHSHN